MSQDYTREMERAHRRLDEDRRRPDSEADVLTRHEEVVRTHTTASAEIGEPCDACGEPWPCPAFRSVTDPD